MTVCAWCLAEHKDTISELERHGAYGSYYVEHPEKLPSILSGLRYAVAAGSAPGVSHGICRRHKDQILRGLKPRETQLQLLAA